MEKTPAEFAGTQRLRAWAIGPEGDKVFRWGNEGDFDRCVAFYTGKMPGHMIKGWCSNLHKLATGARPGHAPGELASKH